MGFRSLLQGQVQGLMDILGQDDGLAPNATYVQVTGSTYDPATRANTRSETTHANIPMVFTRFMLEEVDDNVVVATDQKVLIAALDLPVTPSNDDRIIEASGAVHMVEGVKKDPADSIWILHVRRASA